MTQSSTSSVVAIDLGSNSFHLLEADLDERGYLLPITALARKVQLALDMGDDLSDAAMERGLACLREFAAFSRGRPRHKVRVVGTQALRKAGNREVFVARAQTLLQQPVEIISGEEEAKLAYLGVSADSDEHDLLVADIGGGSTELVTGRGGAMQQLASLPIGCVSWLRYFPGGELNARLLETAISAARREFDTAAARFGGDWCATGCSGTLLAVEAVLRRQGWSDGGISREGLAALRRVLLEFDRVEAVHFQGLSEERRSIFASGVAIVIGLFESLQLQRMVLSRYGLREGVAWELLHSGFQDNGSQG